MKLLLAVDHSNESKKAVAFVSTILGSRTARDIEITLFHVVESLPEYILSRSARAGTGEPIRHFAEEWAESNRASGERLLDERSRDLEAAGISRGSLQTKLVVRDARPEARRVVAALGIIEEMKEGDYNVVVVGRRGTSETVETFLGSVAEKVTREAHGKTVWVVD